MVDFESQYKKYEMVIARLKQVNEFWINSVLSTAKEFFKVK